MTAFLTNVAGIVSHTPLWVWPLYALLLFLGFQRTRDSSVPLWRMLILPLAVTILAITTIIGAGLGALPAALVGLAVGGTAGWYLEPEGAARRLPDGRIWLRGEWFTFAQLVVVTVFRYATAVASAMDPALLTDPTWQLSTVFVSAALSALFLGRTAARFRAYSSAVPAIA